MTDARATAELVARASYGRLVAYLAVRSRDVAAAEDALSDALRSALETWPERGVPANPEAWLFSAARRRLTDGHRRAVVRDAAVDRLLLDAEDRSDTAQAVPDERLRLLFVCAHPAIDPGARTPLMLQTVLGLDAGRIASAFLTSPAAMSQRLVRAKVKIRDAGLRFESPEAEDLRPRLAAVMEAVYAAYGSGWDDVAGADERRRGLADEAIWLARLLVELTPDDAEPKGLLALMLHCEARRPARRDAEGAYVPLTEQNVTLWSRPMIAEAERLLREGAAMGRLGRFQLEAALQSLHVEGAIRGRTDWRAASLLYDALLRWSPTIGVHVARAAAYGADQGPAAGLDQLDRLPAETIRDHQPFWALRAHLLARAGRREEARVAYDRAIGLSEDVAVRTFLQGRAAEP